MTKTVKYQHLIKLVDLAKKRIFDVEKSIRQIDYELSFKYPHHFSRMFSKSMGILT